jgi:hypothetical protein
MPKLPLLPTPAVLAELGAEMKAIPAGTPLARIYFAAGAYPATWNGFRHFGPLRGRFDPHLPPAQLQQRGVMYAADGLLTCLAEVFQARRRIDVQTAQPMLATFALTRDVPLLDLTGLWPTRAGASTAIHSGPRPRAQAWARAIYDAFPEIEGVRYCSSMNANHPAMALFERAVTALPALPTSNDSLGNPLLRALLLRYATRLGYRLL